MGFGYETYKNFIEEILTGMDITFGDAILSVALFGSVARGEAYPESDIDLLIIHESVLYDPVKRFVAMQLKLQQQQEYKELRSRGFYPNLSPLFMTLQEVSTKPLILLDIIDHGIVLKDKGNVLNDKMERLKERLKDLGSKKRVFKDGSWAWDLKPAWKPGEVIEITL